MSRAECCHPAESINSVLIIAGPQARKAGFWIRLAAWVVDLVCLFLATIALALAALITIYLGGKFGGEINDQVMALAGYSSAAIVMLSGVVYFTVFVGSCGQTPGKMLFGLKIVRADGQEMTYGRALLRSLCFLLSLLLFSVGFLMIACTRQKRGLHDMLAGTSVIRLQHSLTAPAPLRSFDLDKERGGGYF